MNPPWILINVIILWTNAVCECSNLDNDSEEFNSTAKERIQREITERERRLIPYMTFYLPRNVGNPNSGERQNVLIPIQIQQSNVERISALSQIQTNNIQNATPQRFEVPPTPSVTVQFPDNGFYPTPSIELTAKTEYKNQPEPVKVLSQIYRFKSPGPQLQSRQQQVHHRLASQQMDGPNHQQVQTRPRVNQKYSEPQALKVIPFNQNYDLAQYGITTQGPQYTYTSAKLQSLTNNPYLMNNQYYFKDNTAAVAESTYIPGKVFAVNIIPQIGPKISVQRLRPGQRQEKTNTNQIFIGSTVPSPYKHKVKFEVEDARLPNLVNVVPVEKLRNPIPITYVPQQISTNYIGEQGHFSEAPNKGQNVYFTHEISQQRPTHITFVPVQPQPPSLNQQAIEIKHVEPIQRTPDSQIDQIQIVEEINTPRPHGHDVNDIRQAHQGIAFEDYNKGAKIDDDGKTSTDNSLVNLLTILKQTNQLPQNFTPENIDNSIKTLALILQRLQNERKYQTYLASSKIKSNPKPSTAVITENKKNKYDYHHSSQNGTPGRAGIDYPTYATIPQTQFDCATQRYKGFFGDPDTNCQVWHYCDLNGGQASFLCPNGTIFSQVALTCDWWFNVKCASTSQLYVLNERLYKYILPFSPSFPEDYSGPLVDRYLAAKFKEMEAKSKLKALKALISTTKPEVPTTQSSTDPSETTPSYNTETQ